MPIDISDALAGAAAAIDEAQGAGAKDIVLRVTLNIGVIHGGVTVNIVPGTCWFEADIRIPPGLGKEEILARIREIAAPIQRRVGRMHASGASAESPRSCTGRFRTAWRRPTSMWRSRSSVHVVQMHVLSSFDYLSR